MEKKIVHYDVLKGVQYIGNRAYLYPLDHPDTVNVSNTKLVLTSEIVSLVAETGRIETQNTIYIPKE